MADLPRPTVRVLCINRASRLLLLRWRDPTSGAFVWEPPGGGIESGESPLEAARRELWEETGLPGAAVSADSVEVYRDCVWDGERYQGYETFFLARVDLKEVTPGRLVGHETSTLQGHRWLSWADVQALPETVEPPTLGNVLTELLPTGPWASGDHN
jgi:8-oxo-dGTP pyrophosphatase MutT (NUDIX family)